MPTSLVTKQYYTLYVCILATLAFFIKLSIQELVCKGKTEFTSLYRSVACSESFVSCRSSVCWCVQICRYLGTKWISVQTGWEWRRQELSQWWEFSRLPLIGLDSDKSHIREEAQHNPATTCLLTGPLGIFTSISTQSDCRIMPHRSATSAF